MITSECILKGLQVICEAGATALGLILLYKFMRFLLS